MSMMAIGIECHARLPIKSIEGAKLWDLCRGKARFTCFAQEWCGLVHAVIFERNQRRAKQIMLALPLQLCRDCHPG